MTSDLTSVADPCPLEQVVSPAETGYDVAVQGFDDDFSAFPQVFGHPRPRWSLSKRRYFIVPFSVAIEVQDSTVSQEEAHPRAVRTAAIGSPACCDLLRRDCREQASRRQMRKSWKKG